MWQRFTEPARRVIFYAQEEAQTFGEGYVSTEHILLGLVRFDNTLAERVLQAMGCDLKQVRSEVTKQLPPGDGRPSQDMSLTPRAKRVIDMAYDEARNLNNNFIGTEHLLLGLIREGEGLAGRVLAKLGVRLDLTRQTVMAHQEVKTIEYPDQSHTFASQAPSRQAESDARDFTNYPEISSLLLGLMSESDEELQAKFDAILADRTAIRAEVARWLLKRPD